ncbi:hypothetical protein [Streptomyces mesophilus]|uniref:hypothetical protein n=1 Tax=Streptomyces mesophilus TaxID=1775132 RepID=UPI00332C5AE4
MTTEPLSRTILLLDIERFSDRDDVEQAYLRRMLYSIADRTLEAAGVDETVRLRADRGDSVMELIEAGVSVRELLRTLLREVPDQLRAVNRMASSSAQMRLRVVLATGWVAVDELEGWVGADLNHACRLLDAAVLRDALKERADDFALCVSESVYAGIVRHNHPGIAAEEFTQVTMDSKNGPLAAWLYGPAPSGSGETDSVAAERDSEPGQADARATAREADGPGTAKDADTRAGAQTDASAPAAGSRFDGGRIRGDNNGVSAGQIVGNISFGGRGER